MIYLSTLYSKQIFQSKINSLLNTFLGCLRSNRSIDIIMIILAILTQLECPIGQSYHLNEKNIIMEWMDENYTLSVQTNKGNQYSN